jgi:hypothetical protein
MRKTAPEVPHAPRTAVFLLSKLVRTSVCALVNVLPMDFSSQQKLWRSLAKVHQLQVRQPALFDWQPFNLSHIIVRD